MTGLGNRIQYLVLAVLTLVCVVFTGAEAATLSMTAASQSVSKGDTFVVEWYLDTEGAAVNVVDASIYFDAKTLTLVDTSTGSSAVSLWIQQPTLVRPGLLAFVGGVPSGVTGKNIPIVRTVFRAQESGTATLALASDAKAALSDGVATIEALTMNPVVFPVLGERTRIISSSTHPNQDRWYRRTTAKFRIDESSPLVYSLSTNPDITPSGDARIVDDEIVYEALSDGVYYFKVAAVLDGAVQELETYRIQIDTTQPASGDVSISATEELYDGASSLNFYVLDKTSGVARTEVKTGWFGWYRDATSPMQLRKPLFGNTATLRTTDKAGNQIKTSVYFPGYLANSMSYCVILFALLWILRLIVRSKKQIVASVQKFLRRGASH